MTKCSQHMRLPPLPQVLPEKEVLNGSSCREMEDEETDSARRGTELDKERLLFPTEGIAR